MYEHIGKRPNSPTQVSVIRDVYRSYGLLFRDRVYWPGGRQVPRLGEVEDFWFRESLSGSPREFWESRNREGWPANWKREAVRVFNRKGKK